MYTNKKASKNAKQNNKLNKRNAARTPGKDKTTLEVVSVSNRSAPRQPKTVMRNGGTLIQHTETFGQNIVGTSAFSVANSWALQPGIATYSKGEPLGVWLPQIAGNFDNYEIESLKFKYRTACSTLTPGLAVFAFEPNPEGTVPTTYQEMRNMFSTDASVHTNIVFDVSSKVKGKKLIRKGTVVNLPSYDMGKVYFATIGVTDNALCGFIDVEYAIKLSNPQSSVTSTEVINTVTSLPIAPVQRFECDSGGWGGIDTASNSEQYWNHFLAAARAPTGANLATVATGYTIPVFERTLLTGNYFKGALQNSQRLLRVAKAGRYRMAWQPRLDWEDLKLFSVTLFDYTEGTGASAHTTRRVYSFLDGSAITEMPTQILSHRGFAGAAVGDPNPATEMFPTFVFDFDAPRDQYMITMRIGVLNYNSASTVANIRGRAGLGDSVLELTYLGPLPPSM